MIPVLRLCFFLFVVSIISCERPIDFEPQNPEPRLVVEGTIENDGYPVVTLTRSQNFFSKLSLQDLAASFVRNARVTISNGEKTHVLKEMETEIGEGLSLYHYTIDSSDLATAFKGELNTTYNLEIETEGEKYTATTTIPGNARQLIKLTYKINIDKKDSSKIALYGLFNDPPGFGNYTRYFTKVNAEIKFNPGLNSIFDDQVVDGNSYELQIENGVDRNSDIDFEEYSFFYKGDDITVKYCNIDKSVYDFWRTMEYSYQSIGNPFSSPTKVKSNISNGALGYFGGYAVQYMSISIPE